MFEQFRQRSLKPERLDTGDYTPEEYAKWHREMWFICRTFGEMRALRGSLLKEIKANPQNEVSILDVGAGSGELLRVVKKSATDTKLLLVGAELSFEAAAAMANNSNKILPVQCDALKSPFADNSFDYVFSSLFLHHLTDEQAIALLGEMNRVARKRFFVIDLHRHPVAYYFYKMVSPLFLQRFTQQDGALSILKSFRPDELLRLAYDAGCKDVSVTRSAAYRLVLSGEIRA